MRPFGAPATGITTMDQDELRDHIAAAAAHEASDERGLSSRIVRAYWPGGSDDRTEPAALGWVRRWRPEILATALPVCSCVTGYCVLCN